MLRFSSAYCTDGGRAINSFEPDWPETLTGFAKRAHEFWQKELEPHGYKLRAQIMDFPGRHAGRRRDVPPLVTRVNDAREPTRRDTEPHGVSAAGLYAARQQSLS